MQPCVLELSKRDSQMQLGVYSENWESMEKNASLSIVFRVSLKCTWIGNLKLNVHQSFLGNEY